MEKKEHYNGYSLGSGHKTLALVVSMIVVIVALCILTALFLFRVI